MAALGERGGATVTEDDGAGVGLDDGFEEGKGEAEGCGVTTAGGDVDADELVVLELAGFVTAA